MMSHLRKLLSSKGLGGFALVQIAMGLGFMALVSASALTMYRVKLKQDRIETTVNRMTEVRAALARYASQNGYLPCPAPNDAAPSSARFGKTNAAGNCADAAVEAGTSRAGAGPTAVRRGSIPVVDLGLPLEYVADAWGNRYVYAVTEGLADSTHVATAAGNIEVLNAAGATVKSNAPYMLVSPSQSGLGTVSFDGVVQTPCPTGSGLAMEQNCANSRTFRMQPFSSAEGANRFDQILLNTLTDDSDVARCGNLGMLYGPGHPMANPSTHATAPGCVPRMIEDPGTGNVGMGAVTGAIVAALDIRGEIKYSTGTLACNGTTVGSLRFAGATMQFCNGSAWVTMQGPKGLTGPQGPKGPTPVGPAPAGLKGPDGPRGADCPPPPPPPLAPPDLGGHDSSATAADASGSSAGTGSAGDGDGSGSS